MMTDKTPAKVYAFGSIGRGSEISDLFRLHGAKNPMDYKFGDPYSIYFVDRNNQISMIQQDSDLFYVITNSSDWVRLEPKKSKHVRKFLITIKEGSSNCNGCEFGNNCTQTQKDKCELGKCLRQVIGCPDLSGKTINIEDLSNFQPISN